MMVIITVVRAMRVMDILGTMDGRETAGGNLGLVQAFVNTVDLQDGP
jgi:hypothetical protein